MNARHRQRPMLVPPPSGDALSHGLAMVTAPVVFGLIGAFLDSRVGTGPIFLLLFAVFGVAASFASAYYRYEYRVTHDEAGKPWTRRGPA
ncbi:MAG: AtpZ/AtpI family protein [Acidimicrobiia bacterium]